MNSPVFSHSEKRHEEEERALPEGKAAGFIETPAPVKVNIYWLKNQPIFINQPLIPSPHFDCSHTNSYTPQRDGINRSSTMSDSSGIGSITHGDTDSLTMSNGTITITLVKVCLSTHFNTFTNHEIFF